MLACTIYCQLFTSNATSHTFISEFVLVKTSLDHATSNLSSHVICRV